MTASRARSCCALGHRGAGPDRRARRHGGRPRAAADSRGARSRCRSCRSIRATSSAANTCASATRSAGCRHAARRPAPAPQCGLLRGAGEEARRRLARRQGVARHAAARHRPTASCSRPVRLWLAGDGSANASSGVRYGIESYFVPRPGPKARGAGAREEARRPRRRRRGGNAAIKGLIIDGELQYEEPLF